MAAKKCLICNSPFRGRVDARTCSPRCRKRLQQLRFSLAHDKPSINKAGGWRKAATLFILGLFGFLSIFLGAAGPPKANAITASSTLNFQGRLLNAAGAVVPDGNYNIDFKLYNADSTTGTVGTCSGACLWEETHLVAASQAISVSNGYFSTQLGSITAFSGINWDQQLYITMNVTTTGTTSCTPRTSCTWNGEMQNAGHSIPLTAVPLAFRANQLAVAGTNEQILQFASSTFGQTTTISLQDPGATTANLCYETAGGAVSHTCAAATGGSGYIQNQAASPQSANFNIQSAANGSIAAVIKGASGQTADLLDIVNGASGSNVVTIAVAGATVFQNSTNSSAGFSINNSSGTSLLTADTANQLITVNNLQATGTVSLQNSQGASILLRTVSSSVPGGATALVYTGAEITDGSVGNGTTTISRSTALQGDGRQPTDSSTGLWTNSTNTVTNGGFESNTTGWSKAGSNTIASSTVVAKFGTHSALSTYLNGNGGDTNVGSYATGSIGSGTFNVSAWVYVPSGYSTPSQLPKLNLEGYTGLSGCSSVTAAATYNVWQRLTCTFTLSGASTGNIVMRAGTTQTANGAAFYFDGVQLENNNFVTPYIETNGAQQSRSAGYISLPTTSIVSPSNGWVAARIRPGWSNTASNSPSVFLMDDGNFGSLNVYFSGGNWAIQRCSTAGSCKTVSQSGGTFSAGSLHTIVATWTSTTLQISVDGQAFTSGSGSATSFGISEAVIGLTFNGDILWTGMGTGTLVSADASTLYNYGNSDPSLTSLGGLNSGASTATFAWDGEGSQYSSTDKYLTNNSQISIDDVNLTHSGNGSLTLQGATNSTAAFQVQNASGTSIFNVDTTNGIVSMSGGKIYLNNATSNTIFYGNVAAAVPGNGSLGEKIQLWGTAGTVSSNDYAIGIEGSNIWLNTAGGFKFYKSSALEASIDTNGYMLLGPSAATNLYTAWSGQSPTVFEVGGTTSTSGNDHYGNITISGNNTGTANQVGALQFANSSLGGSEKRIGSVVGWTDGATNSGKVQIGTANAGVVTLVATFDHLGNLTETGSITGVGVNSGSGQIQGTGGINVSGSATLAGTAGDTTTIGNTTGNINIGTSNASSATISLGGGTSTTSTINIGQATTTAGQNINIQNSLTSGTATLNILSSAATGGTETVNLANGNITATTQSINIAGGSSTTSGGKTVNIATGTPGTSTTNTVAIGTGGTTTGTVGITIGSATAANHTLLLQGGNSNSAGSEAIRLQTADAGGIAIGTTTQTGTITIGKYNGASTSIINVGNNAGASSTQQINIGASGVGINTVTIGSGTSSSGVTINSGSSGVLVKSGASNNSTTAFQVQNASSKAVFAVDTTNGQAVLGTSSFVNGQLLFNNSTNANTITISSGVTSSSYSIILPTTGAASFGQCIQTTGSSTSQLTFGACTATGLGKNVADVSAASVSASNNLYVFTNSNTTTASGVLKLDNGTNTNSALVVTASGNPTSGQALIFASNTNASPGGNLIDLQAGASPTSMFSVSAAGAVVASSTYNTNTFSSTQLTFGGGAGTIAATSGTNNLTLNSGNSSSSVILQSGGGKVVIHTGNTGSTSVSELQLDTLNSSGTDSCGSTNTGAVIYGATTSGTNKQVDSSNTVIGHILGCVKQQGGSTYGWESLDNYVDVFDQTTSGASTYTIPTGANAILITVCGGGGGGANAVANTPGGGGAGGAYRTKEFSAAMLGGAGTSLSYNVGTGGTHGNPGGNGGPSWIAPNGGTITTSYLSAGGGGGGTSAGAGGGGGASGGSAGTGSASVTGSTTSGGSPNAVGNGIGGYSADGGAASSTTTNPGSNAESGGAGGGNGGGWTNHGAFWGSDGGGGGSSENGAGGGGGGGAGGFDSLNGNYNSNGGSGGSNNSYTAGTGAAGGITGGLVNSAGAAGTSASGGVICGGGGGGGSGANSANGGTGGNGFHGGGGGGGGGSVNNTQGAGGDGGAGRLVIIAW